MAQNGSPNPDTFHDIPSPQPNFNFTAASPPSRSRLEFFSCRSQFSSSMDAPTVSSERSPAFVLISEETCARDVVPLESVWAVWSVAPNSGIESFELEEAAATYPEVDVLVSHTVAHRRARVFFMLDTNSDGFIEKEEILELVHAQLMAMEWDFSSHAAARCAENIVAACDACHDGRISLEAFLKSMNSRRPVLPLSFIERMIASDETGPLPVEVTQELQSAFSVIDADGDSFLSQAQLTRLFVEAAVDERGLAAAISEAIILLCGADGKLSFQDFLRSIERDELVPFLLLQACWCKRRELQREMVGEHTPSEKAEEWKPEYELPAPMMPPDFMQEKSKQKPKKIPRYLRQTASSAAPKCSDELIERAEIVRQIEELTFVPSLPRHSKPWDSVHTDPAPRYMRPLDRQRSESSCLQAASARVPREERSRMSVGSSATSSTSMRFMRPLSRSNESAAKDFTFRPSIHSYPASRNMFRLPVHERPPLPPCTHETSGRSATRAHNK